jgi:LytS/YehU family sensor histidine kinase
VPSLIMQPLVENAVVHGLSGHQGRVAVHISARVLHDRLTISVFNTIATEKKSVGEEGIGLRNVRERLEVQFEGRAALSAAGVDGQWCSEITMPAIHHSPTRDARPTAALVEA